MALVAPSMLSADFLHLEQDVMMVNSCADLFHLDIMDGVQVPNLSYGFPVIEAIAARAALPLDVHLMTVTPDRYLDRYAALGTDMLSFHYEAVEEPGTVIDKISALGMKPGIAVNPDFPLERLFPYIDRCHFILIMSVFAGFGGQKFIPESCERISRLKEEIIRRNSSCLIEVDGGIGPVTAKLVTSAGADILVAGSAVFKSDDPVKTVNEMKSL